MLLHLFAKQGRVQKTGLGSIPNFSAKDLNMTIEKIAMGCKPDPYKFKIVDLVHTKDHTIVMANYEGCLSFGGNKLMLIKGIHFSFNVLDPHFLDEDYDVIARFIPNDKGLAMATECAEFLEFVDWE